MKVQEFITKANKVESAQLLKSMLDVKDYLPFNEKKELAKNIVDASLTEEDGFIRVDEINKYLIFTIEMIKAYTNLEFDEDLDVAAEEYDILARENKLNTILGFFDAEYNTVLSFAQMEVDYIMQQNSVEYQVAKLFSQVGDVVSQVSDTLVDKIENFDIGNLGISMDQIAQLGKFLEQYKQ